MITKQSTPELTKAMRWKIADWLAEDRLDDINKNCAEVHVSDTFYVKYVKRFLDIVFSALALIITFPINLIIGIATFIDLGLPLFFRQERVGKNGKIFTIIKFRNMRNTKNEKGELLPPEQRVTKLGLFWRKTSLDELLNFWSIFKGDMSFIGPRPLVPEYQHRFNKRHKMRCAVRPGLECPPRMAMDHVWTWQEQFENDIWYVENVSFITDVKMCVYLIRYALDRKSAASRAGAKRGPFMGYDPEGNVISLDAVPEEYIRRGIEYFKSEEADEVQEVLEKPADR